MALVLPLLLLVLFAIIDFGRMLNAQIILTEAAREGARAAAYGQPVQARVDVVTEPIRGTGNPTPATATACTGTPSSAQVTVDFDFEFITPFVMIAGLFGASPAGEIALTSTGVMTCAS